MQVQVHFKDARNKRVDLIHQIKLDWTQTGLQTFGGETSVSAKLILKPADFVLDTKSVPLSQSSSEPNSINSKYVIVDANSTGTEQNGQSETRDGTSICCFEQPMPVISQPVSTSTSTLLANELDFENTSQKETNLNIAKMIRLLFDCI